VPRTERRAFDWRRCYLEQTRSLFFCARATLDPIGHLFRSTVLAHRQWTQNRDDNDSDNRRHIDSVSKPCDRRSCPGVRRTRSAPDKQHRSFLSTQTDSFARRVCVGRRTNSNFDKSQSATQDGTFSSAMRLLRHLARSFRALRARQKKSLLVEQSID